VNIKEIPFYICHCKKLTERRPNLESEIVRVGIQNAHWVLDFDADELAEDYIFDILETNLWYERMQLPIYPSPPAYRILSKPVTSLVMKHREAYKMFLKTDKPYALISEDDTFFDPDYNNLFEKYFSTMPKGADIIHMCAASGLYPSNLVEGHYFYKNHLTRGTGLYLISRKAAEIMCHGLQFFCGPIDFEINYFVHKHGLESYWLHPLLAYQGSETIYSSSLDGKR
jgi:glycosyl transferase family 25